jgi:hypothetical protein
MFNILMVRTRPDRYIFGLAGWWQTFSSLYLKVDGSSSWHLSWVALVIRAFV